MQTFCFHEFIVLSTASANLRFNITGNPRIVVWANSYYSICNRLFSCIENSIGHNLHTGIEIVLSDLDISPAR